MAGFELTLYGRFWVTPKDLVPELIETPLSKLIFPTLLSKKNKFCNK